MTMVATRKPLGAAITLAVGLLWILAAHACAMEGRPCAPDDYRYCDCPSGVRGYEQCADDGSEYGPCDCSGTIPPGAGVLVEAGVPDADDAGEGGLAGFLEPCVDDGDCETMLCFPFNAYGPHCSQPCTKDTDCPPPSPGCSGKMVCKFH
jgi:hypothetical protein